MSIIIISWEVLSSLLSLHRTLNAVGFEGIVVVRLSGSPKMQGSFKVKIVKIIISTVKPNTSSIEK